MTGLADRGRQLLIAAVGAGAEIDVERDDRRAGLVQSIDDLGMVAARPRPRAKLGKAARIHLDDDCLTGRGALQQLCALGGQRIFGRVEQANGRQADRRDRDQQSEDQA